MTRKQNIFGYGFSLEGHRAAWQELESGLPARGADCPLTADLLDLALGQADPKVSERLRGHLAGCDYCRGRFEAQQRAVQRFRAPQAGSPTSSAYSDVVAEFRQRRRPSRRGKVETVHSSWAADDGQNRYQHRVTLFLPEGEPGLPLHAILDWGRDQPARAGAGGPGPWWVALRFPSTGDDPERGNAESDLAALAGCQVRLDLLPDLALPPRYPESLETQLYWDPSHTVLVSDPDVVSMDDPAALAEVAFFPGRRIQGLAAE
jgi:hypothetical protein